MEREIQFVNIMTEKLKTQGDISPEEAARMFILATVIYAYGMGQYREGRFWDNFNYRFDFSELSDAIEKWYEEVLLRIPDKISGEYRNFIASIPSATVCPPPESTYYKESTAPRIMNAIRKIRREKMYDLRESPVTSNSVCANKQMVEWLKSNVPLSFDVIYCRKRIYDFEVKFARFGVLGLLPIHEREIDEDGLRKLSDLDIPILQTGSFSRKSFFHEFYRVACLSEHKDILDAVADDLPVPERRPVEKRLHTPRDLLYMDILTSRISCGKDVSVEEADDLYLLFKMYQALKMSALKVNGPVRQEAKDSAEPGLKALRSWYKAVEKELKKNRKGNFVYTLPNDTSMNLYCLRDYVERCLKMLPKEPSNVVVRCNNRLPVKDDCLDAKSLTTTGALDRYIYYLSGRYGFFDRNDIDVNKWKTVVQCNRYTGYKIFDSKNGDAILGKLRFAESLGINLIVMNDDLVAVDEKDYDRIAEVMRIPDHEIMQMAHKMMRKELSEITQRIEELKKSASDIPWEKIRKLATVKEDMELAMREGSAGLRFLVKSVEILYNMQKEKDEYLEEDEWMEIDR